MGSKIIITAFVYSVSMALAIHIWAAVIWIAGALLAVLIPTGTEASELLATCRPQGYLAHIGWAALLAIIMMVVRGPQRK